MNEKLNIHNSLLILLICNIMSNCFNLILNIFNYNHLLLNVIKIIIKWETHYNTFQALMTQKPKT